VASRRAAEIKELVAALPTDSTAQRYRRPTRPADESGRFRMNGRPLS
jgi:hypothetical protein